MVFRNYELNELIRKYILKQLMANDYDYSKTAIDLNMTRKTIATYVGWKAEAKKAGDKLYHELTE